jgi:tetratricopeptide (TPR) repeat protein
MEISLGLLLHLLKPLKLFPWILSLGITAEYEDAINDFGTCIALKPAYGKVWFNRGITKMYIAQYDNAIFDLTQAIKIEREYAAAYYNRAIIYELKGQFDFACTDYYNAQAKGYNVPPEKLAACRDTSYIGLIKNPLLYLNKEAKTRCYGAKARNPIPVGNQANLETYLRLLRSPEGKFVYHKILDTTDLYKIELTYTVKDKPKTKTVFFDLKKFENPRRLKGFTTFKQPIS